MSTPQSTLARQRFGLKYYEDEYGVKDNAEAFEQAGDMCDDDSETEDESTNGGSKTFSPMAGFFKPYARSRASSQAPIPVATPAGDAGPLPGRGLFNNVTPKRNVNLGEPYQSPSQPKHKSPQKNVNPKNLSPRKLGMFSSGVSSTSSVGDGPQVPPSTLQNKTQPSFVDDLGDMEDRFRTLEEESEIPGNAYLASGPVNFNDFEAFLSGEAAEENADNEQSVQRQSVDKDVAANEQNIVDSPMNPIEDQASVGAPMPANEVAASVGAPMPANEVAVTEKEPAAEDEGSQGDREEARTVATVAKPRRKRAGYLAQIYSTPPKVASKHASNTNEELLGRTRAATTKAIEEQKPKRPNARSAGAVVVVKQIRSDNRNKATARAATPRKKTQKVNLDTPQRVSKRTPWTGTRRSTRTGGLRNWKGEKLELSPRQGIVIISQEDKSKKGSRA